MKIRLILFLVPVLFTLASCASLRPIPPEVNLLNVRVGEMTLSHANLFADLRVHNTNPIPIALEKVNYNFILNGIRVAVGRSMNPVRIGSNESGDVTLLLSAGYLNLFRFTAGRDPGDEIKYVIEGDMEIGGLRFIDTTFPFREEGTIPVGKLFLK